MGYSLRTGRLIAVIVLLAGLLGMHVLGLHGTSEHHAMSDTAVTHAMTTDAAIPADAPPPMSAPAPTVLQAPTEHGSGADGAMAAMCVLALLAGILLLRAPVLRGDCPRPASCCARSPRCPSPRSLPLSTFSASVADDPRSGAPARRSIVIEH
ncbi:hypothetical protein [Microbacterium sp. NPDC057650]|uniref:hypothetical protein n=1 Tax=unclassified Microbacterium TaxID=2609290 RepID=UPI003671BD2C